MKKHILIFAFMALASVSVFGQTAAPTIVEAKKPALKKLVETFSREKFDPARDPNIDLAAAVEEAGKSGKRIILDVGGEWCGWCVYMDKFFYQNADIAKIRDDNFVWLKINMSPENENPVFLSAYPTRTGYPHLYVLDETGKLLHSQDTAPLESEKGYDHPKFTEFLKTWSSKRTSDVK